MLVTPVLTLLGLTIKALILFDGPHHFICCNEPVSTNSHANEGNVKVKYENAKLQIEI